MCERNFTTFPGVCRGHSLFICFFLARFVSRTPASADADCILPEPKQIYFGLNHMIAHSVKWCSLDSFASPSARRLPPPARPRPAFYIFLLTQCVGLATFPLNFALHITSNISATAYKARCEFIAFGCSRALVCSLVARKSLCPSAYRCTDFPLFRGGGVA